MYINSPVKTLQCESGPVSGGRIRRAEGLSLRPWRTLTQISVQSHRLQSNFIHTAEHRGMFSQNLRILLSSSSCCLFSLATSEIWNTYNCLLSLSFVLFFSYLKKKFLNKFCFILVQYDVNLILTCFREKDIFLQFLKAKHPKIIPVIQ